MMDMAKTKFDNKIDQMQSNRHPYVNSGLVNYCVSGLMARCSAGRVWQEQKRCKYAEKSTVSNRCMHYIAAINGHCDCLEAQKEMEKTRED